MTPLKTTLKTQVKARSGESLTQDLEIINWSDLQRRHRALKALGIGLSLSFAFVFVPIAHFVLVPLTLISTFIGAWFFFNQKLSVPQQMTKCPKCSADVRLPSFSSLSPSETICDACRQVIQIEFLL